MNVWKTGILAVASAAVLLGGCSAMILGEGSQNSTPLGIDGRGSAQVAADEALSEAVSAVLKTNSEPALENVAVSARSGVVKLGGNVGSFEARDRAVQLATAVAGTTTVDNQIRVKTTN